MVSFLLTFRLGLRYVRAMKSSLKTLLDFAPLAAFFVAYKLAGIAVATGVLIAVTLAALAFIYSVERKIAMAPLVTAIIVAVFGGLTLYLHDERFIKMKPTLVYLIFAAILLGGLLLRRAMLKYLFGAAITMSDAGWRGLSRRWGLFFLLLAVLNEVVWRNFTTDQWVNFKVFGALGLTFAFTLAQLPLMKKHMADEE